MELGSISHKCGFADCYALNEDELVVKLQTGKDITAVNLIHEDPYSAGISGRRPWIGKSISMEKVMELKYWDIWEIILEPAFKREQYYFEIFSNKEKIYLLEDDFYTEEALNLPGMIKQYYKYPWMNESDIYQPPKWVEDTIWYQIVPDRFAKTEGKKKKHDLKPWDSNIEMTYEDFFGGDLEGITGKLSYLRALGITGIYLTPIMESESNHKYNTTSYTKIDPDFGDKEEMKRLVEEAHKLGIRVMIDAVFNHCGTQFFAWQDVLLLGKKSLYYNWFYINSWPIENGDIKTKDGRYYSFAFEANMPKLNTNEPAVQKYLIDRCNEWINEWKIDGIRFDVGNEIAHSFVKRIHRELKALKPDLFLLGEIWTDSGEWLLGDEYDSVMNYPFLESINNFWIDYKQTSKELMYSINRSYSRYKHQIRQVLFNFLDTHDSERAYTRCGGIDVFIQQLVLLMTMEGTPCLYYGTEIGMEGKNNPYNRKCMPWEAIENGVYDELIEIVKIILSIRNQFSEMKSQHIVWKHDEKNTRLLHYLKLEEHSKQCIGIYMNGQEYAIKIDQNNPILFKRKYEKGVLESGGIIIYKMEEI